MTIREFAKSKKVTVIGKLERHPEYEETEYINGKYVKMKVYIDEGGNEFCYSAKENVGCIMTADGNVL